MTAISASGFPLSVDRTFPQIVPSGHGGAGGGGGVIGGGGGGGGVQVGSTMQRTPSAHPLGLTVRVCSICDARHGPCPQPTFAHALCTHVGGGGGGGGGMEQVKSGTHFVSAWHADGLQLRVYCRSLMLHDPPPHTPLAQPLHVHPGGGGGGGIIVPLHCE
jgi:hypothetical protein